MAIQVTCEQCGSKRPRGYVRCSVCSAPGKARRSSKSREQLERLLRRATERLKSLESYSVGEYGAQLGLAAVGPCVEVEDGYLRRYIRKHATPRYLGKKPRGAMILHRCDRPNCIEPSHLFYGSQRDNMRDCVLKGRKPKSLRTNQERIARQVRRVEKFTAQIAALGVEEHPLVSLARQLSREELERLAADLL